MRLKPASVIVIAFVLSFAQIDPLDAQRKPKPSPDRPGTLTFSCTSSDFVNLTCDDIPPQITRIIGDDRNYPGIGVAETGEGAFLRGSNGELWLGMGAGLYKMLIDFNERADSPPCALYEKCRLTSDRFPGGLALIDSRDGEIQSNVVVAPGGGELSTGLLGLDTGSSGHARLKIDFTDALGTGWTIRFNPLEYAGSNELPVTRVDACTWRFDSDGDDDDGDGVVEPLAGVPGAFDKKLKIRYDEGLFVLRFNMTLRIPSLCSNP